MTEDALELETTVAKLRGGSSRMDARGLPVLLLIAFAVPGDEVIYGVVTGESPETVTQACQLAGVPAQRVTAGVTTAAIWPPKRSPWL